LVDYKQLSFGITNKATVVTKLKELCGGRGPDVAIECVAGEYPKGWAHWLEMAVGAETDTSEILNEMIEGVRNYGRTGVTGVYVGYVSGPFSPPYLTDPITNWASRPTTSTLAP
jgi:threonine dehydrogenase-like Zn-dependent dehydrogenase